MADSKDAAKQLIPFLQRADELQKHDRRIAYFCASVCVFADASLFVR